MKAFTPYKKKAKKNMPVPIPIKKADGHYAASEIRAVHLRSGFYGSRFIASGSINDIANLRHKLRQAGIFNYEQIKVYNDSNSRTVEITLK
jgi:hypothetical protein